MIRDKRAGGLAMYLSAAAHVATTMNKCELKLVSPELVTQRIER